MIEACPEAQAWLDQFPDERQAAATNLLLKLQFVDRDTYSEWVKTTLLDLRESPCALYAVSKIDNSLNCLWDEGGATVGRPSYSLGSEDLVNSVFADLKRTDSQRFLDHPHLEELRARKIKDVVLVDDSIGSGQRISSFIALMMANRTFLSWWSFGWIRLHVVAFARSQESATRIMKTTAGSDHPNRKFPKSEKIRFLGHLAYRTGDLSHRWGSNHQNILALCDSVSSIPPILRRGYGNAMANIVFYHSVPDNIPGMLWFQCAEWRPLFPDRSVPNWLPILLEGISPSRQPGEIPKDLISILRLVKRGLKNEHGLARAMDLDIAVVGHLLSRGRGSGFLTDGNRLTKAGLQTIWADKQGSHAEQFDRSLYVPSKWCVDRETVQPSE